MSGSYRVAVMVATLLSSSILSCGGKGASPAHSVASAPGGSTDPSNWPKDDHSMCDWKNHPELEVSETAGPGAIKPNVRRVYQSFGEGETRHKTMVCREIDTNLDGIKDVMRTFNAKGEAVKEVADTDYDGRIDQWLSFVEGRLSEEDIDTNHDGKPDVWKYYLAGVLSRVKLDKNFDGKPDTWEIYADGKLERVGVDETYDGHVDRWERDEQLKKEQDIAEVRARDAASDGGAPASNVTPDAGSDAGATDAGTKRKNKL